MVVSALRTPAPVAEGSVLPPAACAETRGCVSWHTRLRVSEQEVTAGSEAQGDEYFSMIFLIFLHFNDYFS